MSARTSRRLVFVAVILLLLCLVVVLFQVTEVDLPVANAFRGVAPIGLKDLLRPLRAPEVLTYGPAYGAKDISPTAPITISFLTPMSPSDNSIVISPTVRGSWSWLGRDAVFTPSEAWPLGASVSVSVTRDVRSWLLRRADKGFGWTFDVLASPSVVSTEPQQGAQFAYLKDRLAITFNREMDHASVEQRLKVTPAISNMRLAWEANQLIVGGNLRPSTTYQFFLPSGAKDTLGLSVTKDFAWSFTTTQQYPYLAIVNIGRYGVTAADKATTLKIQSVNVSRLDAALYRFDATTYVKTLGFSYDSWRNFKPQGDPVKTWSLSPQTKIDQYLTQDLTLDPLPAGTYFLTVKSPEGVNDTQVLVATKTALTLKRTTDQVLVWATNISDGSAVPGLALTFYDAKGQSVGTGTTGPDGVYQGGIQPTKDDLNVVGVREGDVAAVSDSWDQGIEPWRFDNVQWQWNPVKSTHRVYVYTDRPIYRPGQTVFFKAIVRSDDDGAYSQPPAGTEVHVKVGDWQNRVLYDRTLKTDAFGSLADSFAINPEAGLGTYQVDAMIGDETYSNEIQVQEYRKPEYSVNVSLDRDAYINGDPITATISANYFFGGAVAGAKVHWTLYTNDYNFYWSGGDFDFSRAASQVYYGYGQEVSSDDAVLSANGDLVLHLPADISAEDQSQVYTLEATVTDDANQPQSATATALIHRGTFYIGMKPTDYVTRVGQEARFDVATVDTTGKIAPALDMTYTLKLVDYDCHQTKDDKGRKIWKCDEIDTPIQQGNMATDATGKYQLAFTPSKGGSYRLDAQGRDSRGDRVTSETWLWVSDTAQFVAWEFENNDRISLILDKKQYNVGDTAHVLVQSPFAKGTALVTIERGKIISHQIVPLDSNSATIDVPILDSYYPNVYVSAILIPQGGSPDGLPDFKFGLANLKVVSSAKDLNVSVSTDRSQYGPRDTATYSIKTTDSTGAPVSAEVSLSVVDKSVLALASDTGPDIVQAFYGQRDLAVRTSNSLTVFLARVNEREDYGGGGGGGEEPRQTFPDIAYWNPAIVTDASGHASVDVKLPDNLTTWEAIANGATASTQVGKATADTLVTKDLIVRPVLPRFLNVGDKVNLGAIVVNTTAQTQTVTVSMTATNLTLPSALSQSVSVGGRRSAVVNWAVAAPTAPALSSAAATSPTAPLSTTITMSAQGGSLSDAVKLSLPIEPFGEKRVAANAGEADDPETQFTVTVPKDATLATLKLSASPSLAAGLVDSLQYLTGYPYGCVEQTMSRFLPDVVVKQTLDKLKIKNDQITSELPQQVADSLNRLYNFQHSDGGWGWWEDDDSQPYETTYVVYGLLQAKNAGYSVDDKVIKNALDYLNTPLVETGDYDLKVYIAYIMAQAGQGDPALARSMIDQQSKMSIYSRATLALLLHSYADDANAKPIVSELEKSAIETAEHAHWEESKPDQAKWEFYPSNGRTTATVLRALLAIDPQSPLVQKTVRYLMLNRLGGYWQTTQETAQTILALTDFLSQTGELNAAFSYQVYVDGTSVATQTVTRDNVAQQEQVTLHLAPGDHAVRIDKTVGATGRLYYATDLEYYSSVDKVGAAKSLDGPTVRREYIDPSTDNAVTTFHVGDMVRVRITVNMPAEGWYMMVTDPLPAGFEAINYSLNTSGIDPTNVGQFRDYWSHPDLRDDRAVFFTTYLWKGQQVYSYLIRATSSGTFRALPAEAVPMYEPDVFGRSASAAFIVAP